MGLSTKVLIGLALGILVGLFFGELVSFLGIFGQVFILLLQITVLPYVVVSLTKGLGSLSYRDAVSLAKKAGTIVLVLWGISLGMVLLMPLAFPNWESASFFSTALVKEKESFNFLELFIPSNPFYSLSANIVPAVVVFSIAFGIALIGIERKQALIDVLDAAQKALGRITGFMVQLAPYGVFAIAAHGAGTMAVDQFRGLQVYIAAYVGIALVLCFWTLPMLVTTLTPLRYRDIVGLTRDALVTAFATGNLFVVLPILTEKSKELLNRMEKPADDSAESQVGVVVPASDHFPSAGKLLSLAFVLFAGWLTGFALSASQYPRFVLTGLSSFFGSTLVAVPFLLNIFRVPADTFQLFVIVDNLVSSRFGAMLAAMHTLSLALLSACAVSKLITFRWPLFVRYVVLTAVFTFIVLGAVRVTFESLAYEYDKYDLFIGRSFLYEPVEHRVLDEPPETIVSEDDTKSTLDRIYDRGFIRVGYRKDALPWAFRNADDELVGLDIEMAHRLAAELKVTIEFVRVPFSDVPGFLDAGYLDIVMSGFTVTTDNMKEISYSAPYIDETRCFIVKDHLREVFGNWAKVRELDSLTIAVPNNPYYIAKLRDHLPHAEIVILDSPREYFAGRAEEVDALVFGAASGSSWCLIYPEYSVTVPHPNILAVPLAYVVAREDREMVDFLDTWVDLKRKDKTIASLFDYWILGKKRAGAKPRWSIIRDVLGWLD